MPEKAVYTLTDSGKTESERLMLETSAKPIRIFLDFNAVIVNLAGLSPENQAICLSGIENNVKNRKPTWKRTWRPRKTPPASPKRAWPC